VTRKRPGDCIARPTGWLAPIPLPTLAVTRKRPGNSSVPVTQAVPRKRPGDPICGL